MTVQPFYFKKFKVYHDKSTMKVGTDSVLLGAWTETKNAESILDIGTGCGVIALMLAQKSSAFIDAIEIDKASYNQAVENFKISPWSYRLKAVNVDFKNFILSCKKKYSLIVSNPPYFIESLKSNNLRKNIARHNDNLTFDTLAYGISKLMLPNGKASLILPINEFQIFKEISILNGLFCNKLTYVLPMINKNPNRVLSLWSKNISARETTELYLKDKEGIISNDYFELTKEFYL